MCCHHKAPRDNHGTNGFLGERNHQTTHLKSLKSKSFKNGPATSFHQLHILSGLLWALLWAMFQLFSAKSQPNIHASNDTTISNLLLLRRYLNSLNTTSQTISMSILPYHRRFEGWKRNSKQKAR